MMGDLDADFGFAGMFWSPEASLSMARFRSYDPGLGRWLSRDPMKNAELAEGPNLFEYAANNPANVVDPLGLCCEDKQTAFNIVSADAGSKCAKAYELANAKCLEAISKEPWNAAFLCEAVFSQADKGCQFALSPANLLADELEDCLHDCHRPCYSNNPWYVRGTLWGFGLLATYEGTLTPNSD
jgi:RHS repeat-associated protein